MKIYILTLHWVANFGANLQAYSTYNYLAKKGHQVKIIDYRNKNEEDDYKRICSKEQYNKHLSFIEDNLCLTYNVHDLEGIVEIIKKEQPDIVIVGSDAVWRQGNSQLVTYWLDSLELNGQKTNYYSLAVSLMGSNINKLSDKLKDRIESALTKFNYVTLRDEWSLKQIHQFRKSNISYCSDPVFLLNKEEMMPIENKDVKTLIENKEKYILVSVSKGRFSSLWFSIIKKLINRRGYKLVELPMPEGNRSIDSDYSIGLPLNANDWFLCIANASGYIGERFHAMVSCINNNIPFVIIDTYGSKLPSVKNKKSKIYDLADRVDCLKYIVHKRNPLLFNPYYIFHKFTLAIKNNSNIKYLEKRDSLKRCIRDYLDNILNL